MKLTEKTCLTHKKSIIYTYNNKNYCKDCLNVLFEAIYKAIEVLNEKPK